MSYRQHIDTLIRLQNRRCRYCWDPMGGNPNDPSYPTVDHIVPQSRGGSDDIHNLVAACRGCNSAKGTMSQSQFMTHQRGRAKCTEYTRSPPTEYTPIYTGPPQGDPTYPSAQTVVYVLGALTMVAGLVMVFLLWPRGNTIYDGPLAVDAVSWPTPPGHPPTGRPSPLGAHGALHRGHVEPTTHPARPARRQPRP